MRVTLTSFVHGFTEEAFTTENWIVRIYKVKKEDDLGRDHRSASAFAAGKKRKKSKPVTKRRFALE
jgi:dolichyl-diphosphooligosaccharide--protein glycosyltransferase